MFMLVDCSRWWRTLTCFLFWHFYFAFDVFFPLMHVAFIALFQFIYFAFFIPELQFIIILLPMPCLITATCFKWLVLCWHSFVAEEENGYQTCAHVCHFHVWNLIIKRTIYFGTKKKAKTSFTLEFLVVHKDLRYNMTPAALFLLWDCF